MSKKISIILWSLAIFASAVYWLGIGGIHTVIVRNTIYLSIPLIAVISGIFSLCVYGFKGSRAKTLVLLTSGMGCWFLGEVFFYSYEFILHTNPFPSIADIFYILAYPLMFFALINEIQQSKIAWKKISPLTLFLYALVALTFAWIVFYFGVYLSYDPHEVLFTNLIAISYGIGDLLLIIVDLFMLILAWEFRKGSFSSLWVLLFFSFIFMLVGDILFAQFNDPYKNEVWFYKSLLDTVWITSYTFFASGLFNFGFSILKAKTHIKNKKIHQHKKST
jgi:hypothetical protein